MSFPLKADNGPTFNADLVAVQFIGPDKEIYLRKSLIIFLSNDLNVCFGCSNEPYEWDGSFEYQQHMFCMRNKENNFPIRTLIWRPAEYMYL